MSRSRMPNRKFAHVIKGFAHAISGVHGGVRKMRRARFYFLAMAAVAAVGRDCRGHGVGI